MPSAPPRRGADRIRAALPLAANSRLDYLTVLPETDSTNAAIGRLPPELQHAHANLLAVKTDYIVGTYQLRAAMGTLLEK